MNEFRKKLQDLINECSMENKSDTPDFILAEFLHQSLAAFDTATVLREGWYGREKPGDTNYRREFSKEQEDGTNNT